MAGSGTPRRERRRSPSRGRSDSEGRVRTAALGGSPVPGGRRRRTRSGPAARNWRLGLRGLPSPDLHTDGSATVVYAGPTPDRALTDCPDPFASTRAGFSSSPHVPPELRVVEADEIDLAYRSNPLMQENRAQAIWSFLAQCEDEYVCAMLSNSPELALLPDIVVNLAKWPMRWIWESTAEDGDVDSSWNKARCRAAKELYELAYGYFQYETVFSLASKGRWHLRLEGNRIVATDRDPRATQWDAYDRVVDATEQSSGALDPAYLDTGSIAEIIPPVWIDGEHYRYSLSVGVIETAMKHAEPVLDRCFELPDNWKLGQYTLGQYGRVLRFLHVVATIHLLARLAAISQDVPRRGYVDSLVMMDRRSLIERVAAYSGMRKSDVWHIIQMLTFGGHGIRQPDIALQPIVPLGSHLLGWSPLLVSSSALERNLVVLLNRFSDSQRDYSALSGERERLLRKEIEAALEEIGVRHWRGEVPKWGRAGDIDLVAIDDRRKVCLVMELKSFVGPADPSEVHNRSRELEKGIRQLKKRKKMSAERRGELNRTLDVDSRYDLTFVLVSKTSAGCGLVLDDEVPIVRSSNLIDKLRSSRSLCVVVGWLKEREFLPVEGRDYVVVHDRVRIGNRVLEWYRIGVGQAVVDAVVGGDHGGRECER